MKRKRLGLWMVGLVAVGGAVGGAMSAVALARDGEAQGKKNGIVWSDTLLVQLRVADLDRSIAFYTETLGFELELRNDDLKWARVKPGIPGVTIGLGASDAATVKGSGTVSMNFGVNNLDETRAILESKGVQFLGPTIDIPGVVRLADLKDPDGNMIRLAGHSPRSE